MKTDHRIGVAGAGNMGGAIIAGIIKGISPSNITVYDTDKNKSDQIVKETGVKSASSIEELINYSEIFILAVKRDVTFKIAEKLSDYNGIIVSLAAGVTLDSLKKAAGEKKLIRAMPNTPALIGCGMTVMSPSDKITNEESTVVMRLLEYTGRVLILDEKYLNAVTGLSGSGPAYVFTFIQALADAGVKMGLTRNDSLLLAGQTIFGSAKMFLDKLENPIKLRDSVASPGGTTIEALHRLDRAGFSGIVIDAVESAVNRAKEIEKY